jgi:hypothetical protein
MNRYVTVVRSRGAGVIPIDGHDLERVAAGLSGWRYDRAAGTLHAPGEERDGLRVWLAEGQLWTLDADEAALARLIALAGALGARVRGADGQTYRTPYETYRHPDDATAVLRAAPPPPPRQRSCPAIPYRTIVWTALLTALVLQFVRLFR